MGLNAMVKESIFFWPIPQYNRKRRRTELLPHPFLCPHMQGSEFFDSLVANNGDLQDVPLYEGFESNVALSRFYVDAVEAGGASRKSAKQKFVENAMA